MFGSFNNKCLVLYAMIVCMGMVSVIQTKSVVAVDLNEDWRLDNRYDPWTMQGRFILGTPNQCTTAPTPENGRWVCSYGFGENGRSLCMVDCKRNFIIKDMPQIFSCNNGVWKTFPVPEQVIDLPYGECISIEQFNSRKTVGMWRK